MLIRMAWRNIWRNPRRSLITLCAMTFSLTLMIVATNVMEGMNRQMVGYAADRSLGHVQAHAEGYYKDRGLHDTLPFSILELFNEGAFRVAPRAYAFGLASLGEQSAGVQIRGIDPAREREVTDVWKHMLQGRYFRPGEEKVVVLGRKIAKTLNAKPGSEIALITQAADGSLGNDLYRVVGVLKTSTRWRSVRRMRWMWIATSPRSSPFWRGRVARCARGRRSRPHSKKPWP
jgi:ABC-type lipoprotein release transport system permease subunit